MVVKDDQNTTVGMNGRVYMSYDDNGDLVHVLEGRLGEKTFWFRPNKSHPL